MDSIFAIFNTGEWGDAARSLSATDGLVMEGYDTPSPSDLTWVIVLATLCMTFMAWGIGANDVANSFATAFGAKCLTARQACCIAAVCELAGAVLLGGHVSDTIRKGMMSVKLYDGDDGRVIIMAGMTSVLLAAASWLLVASKYGLPVSTTHSAVGGVIAFAVASKGYDSVNWEKVAMIVASWFVSPTMSGVVGFITYTITKYCVLMPENSLAHAKVALPFMVFIMTFTVSLFTIYKGAKGIGLHKTSPLVAFLSAFGISTVVAVISYPVMLRYARYLEEQEANAKEDAPAVEDGADAPAAEDGAGPVPAPEGAPASSENPAVTASDKSQAREVKTTDPKTEQMFKALVVACAGFQSIAHGANDVANSVGPFGAILAAKEGELQKKTDIALWVFFLAGGFIVIGLASYGLKVMQTIGEKITVVTPSKAACAQFSATLVVLLATRLGLPISTTHAAVGGVLGVGLADGVNNINWRMMVKIFGSWIITLPICGITAVGIYGLFLPLVLVVN
jgi:phosphate/sulfate permease